MFDLTTNNIIFLKSTNFRIKDKQIISENENTLISVNNSILDHNIFKLQIKNFDTEGIITCKIKNIFGEVSSQTKVNVLKGPIFLKRPDTEYNLKLHDVAKLFVEVNGVPKPDICWFKMKDSQYELIVDNEKYKIDNQKQLNYLTIKDLSLDDTLNYMCSAKNSISEATTETHLKVFIEPEFLLYPQSITDAKIGENLELNFKVMGFPLPEITLLDKLEQRIIEYNSDPNYEILIENISTTEKDFKIVIKSVSVCTIHSYECIAKNTIGHCKIMFDISILKRPEFISLPTKNLNLVQNSDILIESKVSSNPDASITWFKDDSEIISSKKILISETKFKNFEKLLSLKISGANKDDSGSYMIVAKNKIGEEKCSTNVLVEYAPIIIKDLKKKEKISEESSFRFECIITGNPIPDVKW